MAPPRSCAANCPECILKSKAVMLQQPTQAELARVKGTAAYSTTCPNGLQVEPSTVPAMGQGVTATRSIGEGTILGYYQGTVTRNHPNCHYDFGIGKGYSICSGDEKTSNWSRFINHHKRDRLNAEFRIHFPTATKTLKSGEVKPDLWVAEHRRAEVFIVTTRRIRRGEEIFVDYGPEYNDQLYKAGFKDTCSRKTEYTDAERLLFKRD